MMRPLCPTFRPGLTQAVRAALVLAAVGLFGACDRHSAEEVPENYGHGSSHRRNTPNHQADSTKDDHFSDSAGLNEEEAKKESHEPPAASAAPSVSNKGF